MASVRSNNSTESLKRNFSDDNRESDALFAKKQKLAPHRKSLPIATVENQLVQEVWKHDTLIIVGETGGGKTTQLPQFLYNAGFCGNGRLIGITQPSCVAAVNVSKRVAEECGVKLGETVGYSIRFENVTSSSTRIKYMTDGFLLREAISDPSLSRYSVIIVDEAHERTVETDVLLGVLKNVQRSRSESVKLKLIIMSASLDARIFSEYFGGARAVHIQGRQFPVDKFYTYHLPKAYLHASLITLFQIHLEEEAGDILVFLTGKEEIEFVERLVKEKLKQLPENSQKLVAVPLFSSLPSEQQTQAFTPACPGFRKVILATKIAETSVTIPGIKYVIDPGFAKVHFYNPNTGLEPLIAVPISKAQALQRSGRAGRERPGKCFRLYPENEFWKLEDSTKPDIKRCDLSNAILQLKALGVHDITRFDFIEKPTGESIIKSLEQLTLLGALGDDRKLSDPVGRQMARLPLPPIYSKALIKASELNCLEEMLITVAMLSAGSMFFTPREKLDEARTARKRFENPEGDHLTLINVYRASDQFLENRSGLSRENHEEKFQKWCKKYFIDSCSLRRAREIHSQIHEGVEQMGLSFASCGDNMFQFRRCLAASFFLKVALKQSDGQYRFLTYDPANELVVQIHPSSVLFGKKPECIVFNELVETNDQKFICNTTRIDYSWSTELAPPRLKKVWERHKLPWISNCR
ncbi:hypothetical protein M0R45_010077 [Rubus argutus]|uniref:RNA helicase n=1 Tax=Rubus argutus TaxID=59490 RepID=A0AAW1Y5X3_RUBAR